MKVNDLASRILVSTLERVEVGVAHHTDLLVEYELPGEAQQIYSGRLNDAQADERGSPAYCEGQIRLSAVRMTDQVHGATGSMDDGLDDVRLVVDRDIAL